MSEEELTLLVRTIANSGFVITGAHRADSPDTYIITVKAPPVRA